MAEVTLWAVLLALVPNPQHFVAGPGAFAASGAVLLAALSFGGWPRVWTFYVAAWVGEPHDSAFNGVPDAWDEPPAPPAAEREREPAALG